MRFQFFEFLTFNGWLSPAAMRLRLQSSKISFLSGKLAHNLGRYRESTTNLCLASFTRLVGGYNTLSQIK